MDGRVEDMNLGGGFLATCVTVLVSVASGWAAGSLEVVRALLADMTQAQATFAVGLFIGLLSQVGVWLRWYLDRRRKGKANEDSKPR